MSTRSPPLEPSEKKGRIAHHFREIMSLLGLDLSDPALLETPERVAKLYVDELFFGLEPASIPPCTLFANDTSSPKAGDMVRLTVYFTSLCAHHFLPMMGHATIAYVPNQSLIGLSSIPRLVHFLAARPQLQERLTTQIADTLSHLLQTEDIAVSLTAQHACIIARQCDGQRSTMTTHTLRGQFDCRPALQQAFFSPSPSVSL